MSRRIGLTALVVSLLPLFLAPASLAQSDPDFKLTRLTYRFPGAENPHTLATKFREAGYPYHRGAGISEQGWTALVERLNGFHVDSLRISSQVGQAQEHGTVVIAGDLSLDESHSLARAVYHFYRSHTLPVVKSKIEALVGTMKTTEKEIAILTRQLDERLEEGETIENREAMMHASSDRTEMLRSRLVDVRIRQAILDAKLQALSVRYAKRRTEVTSWSKLLEKDLAEIRKKYAPDHPERVTMEQRIEDQVRRGEADDDQCARLQQRLTDAEIELVEAEEEEKAIRVAQEKELTFRKKLLLAPNDLGDLVGRLDDLRAHIKRIESTLVGLRIRLSALETGEPTEVR